MGAGSPRRKRRSGGNCVRRRDPRPERRRRLLYWILVVLSNRGYRILEPPRPGSCDRGKCNRFAGIYNVPGNFTVYRGRDSHCFERTSNIIPIAPWLLLRIYVIPRASTIQLVPRFSSQSRSTVVKVAKNHDDLGASQQLTLSCEDIAIRAVVQNGRLSLLHQ